MSYNISQLPVFQTEGKGFVIKSILEAQTLSMLTNFDTTAKGITSIQVLDTDITITDGSACGRNPSGGATLAQGQLIVKPLKINQDYCSRTLDKTWAKGELAKGQDYDVMVFMNEIGELNSKQAQVEIDKMIWHGDVNATGSTTLRQMDGYIKQIKAGAYINLSGATTPTGATMIDKLWKAYKAMPVEVRTAEDFVVLIGTDVFDDYKSDLADKNLFNPPKEGELLKSGAKYKVLNALAGGHIVMTRLRSLHAGGELTDVDFKQYYDYPTDVVMFDSRFSLGVTALPVNEIGYVKI